MSESPKAAAREGRPLLAASICGFLGAAAFLALDVSRPLDLGDESFQYLMSSAWARGENLFAQFQVLYPTGQYAFFGTLFHLLGDRLWVLRLGRAILSGIGIGVLVYAVRRVGVKPGAAALLAASAALCAAKPASLAAASPVVLLTLLLALRRPPGRGWVFAAATLAGLLAGFREDSAVLALLLALLGVAWRRRPAEMAILVLPGIAAGFAPWLVIEGLRGDAFAFAAHCAHRLVFLGQRLAEPTEVRRLPIWQHLRTPRQLGSLVTPVLALVPPLAYLLLLAGAQRRWWRGEPPDPRRVTAAVAGLAYLPQFLWERPDFPHFCTHLPILLTVLTVAAASARRLHRRLLAALLVAVCVIAVGGRAVQRRVLPPVPYPCCDGARIGATLEGEVPAWAGLRREPGETLIVLGWSPGWYVLEGLPPGSRHLSTFARHLATDEQRDRLATDLARPSNRWVIASPPGNRDLPPQVQRSLEAHYRRIENWRGHRLWQRLPQPRVPHGH